MKTNSGTNGRGGLNAGKKGQRSVECYATEREKYK